MAKIRLKKINYGKRMLGEKVVRSKIALYRRPQSGFLACVRVGTPQMSGNVKSGAKRARKTSAQNEGCAAGPNPRMALVKALREAARKMSKRTGAFAGL